MKISVYDVKTTPPTMPFGICVYGKPTLKLVAWANYHGFELKPSGNFTNIIIPEGFDICEAFEDPEPYQYLDGFSPNLNKELHFGHFTNLIVAKAISNLCGIQPVAILGDTLGTDEEHLVNFNKLMEYYGKFNYVPQIYYASKMKLVDEDLILMTGEDKYEGTKIFDLGEHKHVGIKSDGSTTYFYQDIAFAQELNADTLILTGTEQKEHFEAVSSICPTVNHKGLGLVKVKAWHGKLAMAGSKDEKMSSRLGNVIFMKDIIAELEEEFGSTELAYNVIAGKILNYKVSSEKKVNKETLKDHKNSEGLYVSYTMARLKSAGCEVEEAPLSDFKLVYAHLSAKTKQEPHIFMKALVDYCKEVNKLYETHYIKDNPENKVMFTKKLAQIEQAFKLLGLFSIEKV